MKNKTIGTVVPPDVEKRVVKLVKEGYYRGKSDFVQQAIIENINREYPRPTHERPSKEETQEIGNKLWRD